MSETNEKSRFAAKIAEMSGSIQEQGRALVEKARAFIGDQTAVVRAWVELQAEKLGMNEDEELFVAALEREITPATVESIDINQVVAAIFDKIKFKLKHPNRFEFSGNKLLTILTLLVCFSMVVSACGAPPAKAFSNTEAAATATGQAGTDIANGTQDVPTPTLSWTPISPTEIPPTEVPPTAIPEIVIDPAYLEGIVASSGSEQQFPTKIVNKNERRGTYCAVELDSVRTVNFQFANLDILRVADCFFVDAAGKTQTVTMPLAFYNRDTNQFRIMAQAAPSEGKPTDAFIDGQLRGLLSKISPTGKYLIMQFGMGKTKGGSEYDKAFMQAAVDSFGTPSDIYYDQGVVDEFPDKPNAENFVIPAYADFKRGE